MSSFPSYKPTSRRFNAGTIPVSSFKSLSGKETRVILGSQSSAHQLNLSFANTSETVVKKIMEHWYNRKGAALTFTLPSNVWVGWTNYTAAVSSKQAWRYAGAPTVVAVSPSRMNINVSLLSVI